MSIHDFHSRLMSGNEEGRLIQALRKLRKSESPGVLIAAMEAGGPWSLWAEEEVEDGGGSLCTANA